MSRLRFTGGEERVAAVAGACVRFDQVGGTSIALTAATPAPATAAHPAHGWLQGAWGTEELDIAGSVAARSDGFVEFEVCTPLGPPTSWCAAIAAHHGLTVEVLWNDELGHAGRILFDGGHRVALPMRSDALVMHGWGTAPWVFDPEPREVVAAKLLVTLGPPEAARLVRGTARDDSFDAAVSAATMLAALIGTNREFVDATLRVLEDRERWFGAEVRRFLAPLIDAADDHASPEV